MRSFRRRLDKLNLKTPTIPKPNVTLYQYDDGPLFLADDKTEEQLSELEIEELHRTHRVFIWDWITPG